eukprot:390701-Pelagomonas_calceolata.AAC.2
MVINTSLKPHILLSACPADPAFKPACCADVGLQWSGNRHTIVTPIHLFTRPPDFGLQLPACGVEVGGQRVAARLAWRLQPRDPH